ncbi:alpha/beta fold hydrolase [Curtobacterium sp. VKM Ac-2922]|uniref:alpha/beta fold hydrolase n=1 Tax=Curtobacterium sp. VKM Ac-2922 TaxID=2929475 RepID=UPI001FB55608|nr:alpha/beta fold hydrolase [Curtobacterium sp. VKM Ac-2922]MCJ1714287.1 alpha/beta fold hydrolase [Curtobacterium sp. VKM Ac-2922]
MRALVETVSVDGVLVRLRTMAPAGRRRDALAPTIVLVHGIGMSHRSFARSQRVLSRSHRTIAVDLPGFGGLPPVGRRLEVHELADVVMWAVRSRGVHECVLVGQSMGSQVVVAAALHHPDAVVSVVLVGPVVDDRHRSLPWLAAALGRDGLVEDARMNVVLLTDYFRSLRQYVRQLTPMLRYPMLDAVAALRVPVLVVRGSRDPISRSAWAGRLTRAARDGTLVELYGGHHVQEHQPGPFAELVDEFRQARSLEATR